jgi:hypothetical protein
MCLSQTNFIAGLCYTVVLNHSVHDTFYYSAFCITFHFQCLESFSLFRNKHHISFLKFVMITYESMFVLGFLHDFHLFTDAVRILLLKSSSSTKISESTFIYIILCCN